MPNPFLLRESDGSLSLQAVGVNLPDLVEAIWRLAYITVDDDDNELATDNKELDDLPSGILALLTEAGLCPPLETYDRAS